MAEPAAQQPSRLAAAVQWIEELFFRIDATVDSAVVDTVKAAIGQRFDAANLGFIPEVWSEKVVAFMMPLVEEAYQTGAISAGIQLPLAKGAYEEALPDADPDVLNPLQAERMALYENRLRGIGDVVWEETRLGLAAGMEAGEGIPELAARVEESVEVSSRRAVTIARTEVISAANAGSMDLARVYQPYMPVRKEWLCTHDARTRPAHLAANGQEVGLDEQFTVGGASLDFPGDPGGPPGQVINCRCAVLFNESPIDEQLPMQELDVVREGTVEDIVEAAEEESPLPPIKASIMDVDINATKNLTRRERSVIETYWSDPDAGSNHINPSLRAGSQGGIQSSVEALDSAILKHRLSAPASVYRGVSGDLLHKLEVGDRIKDPAFLSVTGDRKVAERFAKALLPDESDGKVLRIDLPKGYAALPLPESGLSEFVLGRNARFKVIAVADDEVVVTL